MDEFRTNDLASLAFPTLFPLGFADPTKIDRLLAVSEQDATAHLLRYAEPDPCEPGTMWYPFAEHARFKFWMLDRIRRHRIIQQSSVFLRQNPEEATLTVEELKQKLAEGTCDNLLSKMHLYTANVTGSDSYWHARRCELEAIFEQKKPATIFFTMSFADNHWPDLHRLLPTGENVDAKTKRMAAIRYSHLCDWYSIPLILYAIL